MFKFIMVLHDTELINLFEKFMEKAIALREKSL